MRKILSICCFLLGFCYGTSGQTHRYTLDSLRHQITLESLEGKSSQVTIENDYQKNKIRISSSGGTLYLYDNYYGEVQSRILNKNFLEIVYSRHGGSNQQVNDLLLICIKNGKPHIALDMAGNSEFQSGDNLNRYSVNIELVPDKLSRFSLKLSVRHIVRFEESSPTEYSKNLILKFDDNKGIFYHNLQPLNRRFVVNDLKDNRKYGAKFNGTYPSFAIDFQRYYFIDGMWYRNFWGAIYEKEAGVLYKLYSYEP